jgi:uncharacterized RDD family membrane protein YckC
MGIDLGYRGRALGVPEQGPGSLAPFGRRLGAVSIDWALCVLIAHGFLSDGTFQSASNWGLLVFLMLSVLTVGTVGSTPGKRLVGIRVVSVDGSRLPTLRAVVRSVLLILAVPALIWDRDGRGLHDRLAGAMQIRI